MRAFRQPVLGEAFAEAQPYHALHVPPQPHRVQQGPGRLRLQVARVAQPRQRDRRVGGKDFGGLGGEA